MTGDMAVTPMLLLLFYTVITSIAVERLHENHLLLEPSRLEDSVTASPQRSRSGEPVPDKNTCVCVKLSVNAAFCRRGPFVTVS